ncbi:MAG: hypothetical protein IPL46_05870 [Saprospiraceae bacterium]|nr:hypothetical protein [Saprospiraceae bacterium]
MVSLYLMDDDVIVIENFKDEPVAVSLETDFSMQPKVVLVLPKTESVQSTFTENRLEFKEIPPRTLVTISY